MKGRHLSQWSSTLDDDLFVVWAVLHFRLGLLHWLRCNPDGGEIIVWLSFDSHQVLVVALHDGVVIRFGFAASSGGRIAEAALHLGRHNAKRPRPSPQRHDRDVASLRRGFDGRAGLHQR